MFLFSPDCVIIAFSINAPERMHDSTIAEWGSRHRNLEQIFVNTGGICVMDSAFIHGNYPFLLKTSQDVPDFSDNGTIQRARQATSA